MNAPDFVMHYSSSETETLVLPEPKIPRRIGLFAIIFGAAMIVMMNLPAVFMYTLAPTAKTVLNRFGDRINIAIKSEQQEEVAKLKLREAAETDPTVKAGLEAKRQRLEARPAAIPVSLGTGFAAVEDPRFLVYAGFDISTAILLNVAMIWAGSGLIGRHAWGWRLARRVAAVKIGRLVLLAAVNLLWILPIQLQAVNAEMAPFMKQNQAALARQGMPAGVMTQLVALQTYGGAVVGLVFASAWPIVMLAMLGKAGSRAACGVEPSRKGAKKVS